MKNAKLVKGGGNNERRTKRQPNKKKLTNNNNFKGMEKRVRLSTKKKEKEGRQIKE